MNNTELRVRVLLTLQVALLGMVTASMRSVLVSWTESDVHIRLVFEGAVRPVDLELASEIESEVMSHLPSHVVRSRTETCLLSERVVPLPGEVMVFQRAQVHIG